jgi:DnaJ-class molecular chaperone
MTWHKPTQRFGSSDNFFKILWKDALSKEKSLFGNKLNTQDNVKLKKFNKKDIAAFKILELEIGTIWPKIQNKFKTLVKRFHPDMNSGNKIYENKLKNITLAYSQLKMTYKEK